MKPKVRHTGFCNVDFGKPPRCRGDEESADEPPITLAADGLEPPTRSATTGFRARRRPGSCGDARR